MSTKKLKSSFIVPILVGTVETIMEERMSLLPNTGDPKMDKAFINFKEHVDKCKDFATFLQHFNYIVKTDDPEILNRWLLKVLFVLLKQQAVHDFDKLCAAVPEHKAKELREWLEAYLIKYTKDNNV